MSVYGKFEIVINAATQEELDMIAEAIFSGYAEHILKERILWANYYTPPAPPAQGTVPAPTTTYSGQEEQGRMPAGTPTPPLQRIDTHVSAPKVVQQEPKPERKTGVIGRGRMGRAK